LTASSTKLLIKIFLFLLITSPATALALINGKPLQESGDIFRLVFKNDWVCYGVFIDEYTILTAAHCLVLKDRINKNQIREVLSTNDQALDVKEIDSFIHPDYSNQLLPSRDLGVIKTTVHKGFQGSFQLEKAFNQNQGSAILYGCGKTEDKVSMRARTMGENDFYRLGAILFFLGPSAPQPSSSKVTIAHNDSGGPVLYGENHRIIAISTETTVSLSASLNLPAIGFATSTTDPNNLDFIVRNLGVPVAP
jgi:hypothetical protein